MLELVATILASKTFYDLNTRCSICIMHAETKKTIENSSNKQFSLISEPS
jgi:hypothetical protein